MCCKTSHAPPENEGGGTSKWRAKEIWSSECGAYMTVKARLWPWPLGKSPSNVLWCSLFEAAREGIRGSADGVAVPATSNLK